MMLNNRYTQLFGNKAIIGMIHLAGSNPVKRALEEIEIFEEEGVSGAIIENYHGRVDDVEKTLQSVKIDIVLGVNILPNEFEVAFDLADKYGADFIQLDHVAGIYNYGKLNYTRYQVSKTKHKDIVVLGGVWPKYYQPVLGSNLDDDLYDGVRRAEAIVVTGQGTGKETPLDKIKQFRKNIGTHPLIVGAGMTIDNAYEQLSIADGAIVGTSLKMNDDTHNRIDRIRVRDLMDIVKSVKKEV